MKLISQLQLVSRSRKGGCIVHSPIRLHGIVLTWLSTRKTLPLHLPVRGQWLVSSFDYFTFCKKQQDMSQWAWELIRTLWKREMSLTSSGNWTSILLFPTLYPAHYDKGKIFIAKEAHTFSRWSVHGWRRGCQLYAPPRFTPQEHSWHSFLLEVELTPGPKCGWKHYVSWKKIQWPHREWNLRPSGL
jgi:hypothetical protein